MEEPKGDVEADAVEWLISTSDRRCLDEVHCGFDNERGSADREVAALVKEGNLVLAKNCPRIFRDALRHQELATRHRLCAFRCVELVTDIWCSYPLFPSNDLGCVDAPMTMRRPPPDRIQPEGDYLWGTSA